MPGQWISVDERLPPYSEYVIVYGRSDDFVDPDCHQVICNVALQDYSPKPNAWRDDAGDLIHSVTHWMPIPAPPEPSR